MDRADCLIEAVKNSVEAGCTYAHLSLNYKENSVDVVVKDDGWKKEKKSGEKRGLILIKELSTLFSFNRVENETIVSFSLTLDESMRDIASTAISIFNYTDKVRLSIYRYSSLVFTYKVDSIVVDAKEMRRIKDLIKKEEIKWLS